MLLMLDQISRHFREKLKVFFLTDNLLLNNKLIPLTQDKYQEIKSHSEQKTIAYVDGGQAEIFTGGSLSLGFIRVFAQVMQGTKRISSQKEEFFLFTSAVFRSGEIWYEGKLFSKTPFLHEQDLVISSNDNHIKIGQDRGSITSLAAIARRLAELKLASTSKADYVLLDGLLEPRFPQEEKYVAACGPHIAGLAKSCSLFTTCGNSPVVLLQKMCPLQQGWSYEIQPGEYFVKLHQKAKHIFRFQGDTAMLSALLKSSSDPLFLGYPYGLIIADKMARVSNEEKKSLQMKLLSREENREMAGYLRAMNAHEILDGMG